MYSHILTIMIVIFAVQAILPPPLKKQKPLKSVEPIPLKLIKTYFQGDTADNSFLSTRSDISPF